MMRVYEVMLSPDGSVLAANDLGNEGEWRWNRSWNYGWTVLFAETQDDALARAEELRRLDPEIRSGEANLAGMAAELMARVDRVRWDEHDEP